MISFPADKLKRSVPPNAATILFLGHCNLSLRQWEPKAEGGLIWKVRNIHVQLIWNSAKLLRPNLTGAFEIIVRKPLTVRSHYTCSNAMNRGW